MEWFIFALAGIILNSLSDVFRKKSMSGKNGLEYFPSSFLVSFVIVVCLGLYALFINFEMPPISTFYGLFIMNIGLGIIGWVTSFRGIKGLGVGDFNILMSARIVVTLIFSIVVFGIGLSTRQLLGSAVLIGAIFVVFLNKKSFRLKNIDGLVFTGLTALIYGFAILIDQAIYRVSEPSSYLLIGFSLQTLIFAIARPSVVKSLSELRKGVHAKDVWMNGILMSVGLIFIFQSLKTADNAPLVVSFFQLQMIFGVLFGIVFLKERQNLHRKLTGAVIAFVGSILVII